MINSICRPWKRRKPSWTPFVSRVWKRWFTSWQICAEFLFGVKVFETRLLLLLCNRKQKGQQLFSADWSFRPLCAFDRPSLKNGSVTASSWRDRRPCPSTFWHTMVKGPPCWRNTWTAGRRRPGLERNCRPASSFSSASRARYNDYFFVALVKR